jgi:hypothetical protein
MHSREERLAQRETHTFSRVLLEKPLVTVNYIVTVLKWQEGCQGE